MRKIFLLVFAFAVLTWGLVQYWPTTVHISGSTPEEDFSLRMPFKDKKRLDYFFRDVCFLNTWAYTLMGSKPVSINHYTRPWVAFQKASKYTVTIFWDSGSFPNFREVCYFLNPVQFKLKSGLNTLKKYISLFPHSQFFLLSDSSACGDVVWFALVNKTKLIDLIKLHLGDFQEVLRELGIEPEELYNNDKLSLFIKNLKGDFLNGTILGYGRNNASLYQKYRKMDLQEWPMVSMWADQDDERLEELHEKDLSFQPWEVLDLCYPYFACDPESEETKLLKKTYRKERDNITKYYEGKDVVEATLSLFNQ